MPREVQQDVLWLQMCVMGYFNSYLQISVHDVVFVEVLKGQHYFNEIEFCDCFRKLPMLGYQEE